MNNRPVFSIVLNAHLPFVRQMEQVNSPQERWFFEALSETYLPLLQVFDRLDGDHVPFRMGIAFSPTLCHMLSDEFLIARYLEYTDKQIEFGAREMDECSGNPRRRDLIKYFYDQAVDKRVLFTERYEKNILKVFDYYQRKGLIELLNTAATHAFLPFYTSSYPEAVQAQFEVAIAAYRGNFGKYAQGFWLPELGWSGDLDFWLRSYNFAYTLVDTHALVFTRPFAEKGSFYPVKTPLGVFILARDFYAAEELAALVQDPLYRDNRKDPGYELPLDRIRLFLGVQGRRTQTGYKYWAAGGKELYDPVSASERARDQARAFIQARASRLASAGELMKETPCSLCAMDADFFGRFWHEGPLFLEALFREGERQGRIQFMTPAEYLYKQDPAGFQTLAPGFSSWGANGYAETWLDASNDWMYRHTMRALERMIEIAERFPNNTGLKERTLNQAAREILLVLSSDWSKMLYRQESGEYARNQIESSLRNFTTIYEALGSNYISTEWLTNLERRHNIFPRINYRVFRKKV
jgi:1,4-alpha-glucan branching enzyme